MNAKAYLDHFIIGQENLKRGLSVMLEEISKGTGINLLLRGPSGYGKTYLAFVIASFIGLVLGISPCSNYFLCGGNFEIDLLKKVQILDEAHLILRPENLYPYLDSHKYVFIFCTNEYGELKEPLENRCFSFNFSRYKIEELTQIADKYLKEKNISLDNNCLQTIASSSRGHPRDLLKICEELVYLSKDQKIDSSEDISNALEYNFEIHKGGLNDLDTRYLEFLQQNGTTGLETLSVVLNIPKTIIRNEIEPVLISKRLIQITGKGRKLV